MAVNLPEGIIVDLEPAAFRESVLERGERAVVEFRAAWCPFGALLGPKLRRIAARFGDDWRVARFDVVGNEDLAREAGVEFVPALAIYVDGVQRAVWYGDPPMGGVLRTIEELNASCPIEAAGEVAS